MYYTTLKPIFLGFDTEACKGKIKVLTCSNGNYIEYPTPLECVLFIVKQLTDSSHRVNAVDKIGFWWNNKFDFAVIFANCLKDKKARELFLNPEDERGKTIIINVGDGTERFFKVRYFSSKGFTIQEFRSNKQHTKFYTKKTLRFYDAMIHYQSYGSSASLDYVAQSFGMPAKDSGVDRERLGNEEGYYEANRDRVIAYSIEDARKTQRLAELVCDGFADMMQELFGERVYAKYYFSPASLGKAWLDLRHSHLRNWMWQHLSLKEIEFIFQSYYGGIFDVRRFGLHSHFRVCPICHVCHPATEIDIRSAYPTAIRTIRKLEQLSWKKTDKYTPTAEFGFYLIKTYLNGFLPVKSGKGFSFYPEDNVTLAEVYVTSWSLRWLIKHKCYFEVLEAIEFFPKDSNAPVEYEFRDDIEKMYAKRAELKEQMKSAIGDEYRRLDSLQLALKLILNTGGYGCHASLRKHCCAYSNVVLASLITDYCRAQIAEIASQVGYDNVIFIATDAICYIDHNQKFDENIVFGSELGNVEYEMKKGEVMVLKNGVYWIRTCKCNDLIECEQMANKELALTGKTSHLRWKNRGYEHLDVETLLKASKDPRKQKLRVCVKRFDTITQGAIKGDMSKVGVIERRWKYFDLESNRNRRFIELYPMMTFQTLLRECFETEPYRVGDAFVNVKPIHQDLTEEFLRYYERVKRYDNSAPHPRVKNPLKRKERNRRYNQANRQKRKQYNCAYWASRKERINAKRRLDYERFKLEQKYVNQIAEQLKRLQESVYGLPMLPERRLQHIWSRASSPRGAGLSLDPNDFSVQRLNKGYYTTRRMKLKRKAIRQILEFKEKKINEIVAFTNFVFAVCRWFRARLANESPNPYTNEFWNSIRWYRKNKQMFTEETWNKKYSHFIAVYKSEIKERLQSKSTSKLENALRKMV